MPRPLIVFLLSLGISCGQQPTVEEEVNDIMRGVNWVSPSKAIEPGAFDPLVRLRADWVAIIPYGFIGDEKGQVFYNLDWQWWGEKDTGVATMSQYAHAHNLEVMLKPQVWIRHGDFTGDYSPATEEGWRQLEQSYYNYILHFARLANSLNCGAFCIGVEWKNFHEQRPEFWSLLIDSVRANYSGKLTYAGNWDSYQSFPHWNKLDYIGIDAYFPVSGAKTPTVQQCKDGWAPWLVSMQEHQRKVNKPVLFTEYGYRSSDHCADKPWHMEHYEGVNLEAQQNAYQALFETFWEQPWFAGGFIWKWHPDHEHAGGPQNNRFTPQNKPVAQTIAKWYFR
ncbi:MAG TPA: glycoside hydrolase [Cryomorphaceae bacterium]|nr:glycoside hydrolase [Owenweeksia sp.]MBG00133.1 glycoside hydrolase [Owenweeksia sp.]HAD96153.1 glycoside hydrolase [Cryomorphaceae bacterium]HBF20305.1 glycoside hydrolase [Cryomorphaceae bacterium]HCQ17404.1 glycoside hydrolase [Cryomorphaceae bacterium]|tara:strand:+ start:122 stop:1132 length:1011 start_codon:yes stop_codon:yes gene_type:complete